jgi:hypothetical protein
MIKKALLLLMAGASLTIAAAVMQADELRWHRYYDGSMLLDDDKYGQRLVLPEDYHHAQIIAERHYGEINPDSFTKLRGGGFVVSYDIAPARILQNEELASWARATATTWWQFDLLQVVYRGFEETAVAHAAEDPERAQIVLDRKRATERIPEPSPALVKHLASHNIRYSGKAAAYSGENTWRFEVNDPARSAKGFNIPVPVGSSEKAIMEAIHEACLSDSKNWIGSERIITPRSKEMLSWVRW